MARRLWTLASLVIVATWLGLLNGAAAAMDAGAEPQLRRATQHEESVDLRGLMPILDGTYSNTTGDYDYHYGSYGYNDDEGSSDGSSGSKTVIIGVSIGVGLVLVTLCLTWKACKECCTSSSRRSRHRAFIERSNAGWRCEICYHTNEFSQTDCVLCGTTAEELKMIRSRQEDASASILSAPQGEISQRSASNYLLMSSPRAAWIRGLNALPSEDLTDRQLIARERHQWKRCIGGQHVRWVNVPFEALQVSKALCSVIIRERDFQEWEIQHPPQVPGSSRMSVSSVIFSDSSGKQLSWLTPGTAFVRDDSHSGSRTVRWRLAEEFSTSSRPYSKTIMRVSTLPFSEKAQWFYQYSLKLCSSIVDGYHTIRIHRDRVLKQSMTLFMSAPDATLHRRLRVDFMDEVGVDGGGILREWLHLVCSQLFAESLGLFTLTSSAAHQGYWINRTATGKCTKQLQMYVFFGKLLGKALLEGLLLNVRLSVPLLKHILGVPLKLSDLYLLDETVHSSMMWILENDNTNALGLNFTVDGAELIPNGADVILHDGNKQLYVAKVAQYYLFDSVRAEISSIMEGLRSVISDSVLHVFDFKELDILFSGLPQIDVNDWRQHTDIRFYEQSSHEFELVAWFWEILESFTQDQRGRLLQYVTGSSGVPVEGFKGLTGMDGEIQLFTIQLGKDISTVYTVLPHASTCLNRLDLPLYPSKAELERILSMVIEMDVTGFSSR
ncbi:E3 ubiquitin-protein ligase SMURF1 [Phytophthora ramorum]|uniref:E3 ubiquitin-protein ligase SMURF1 n=1 Tax=Phytophthora ramorum TaxID=164328 RepID=UPI0030B44B5E|nr:E3 ubiquitin-protein ligase SMURF1 [Phytophthora ramorum]